MDLLAGLSYPLRALSLINRTPRLWGYVIVPIMVNLVVGAILYLGLFLSLWQLLRLRLADSPYGGAIVTILAVVLGVALAVAIGFIFVRFGIVLGAPWYGQLSEKLEHMLMGSAEAPQRLSAGAIAYELWRALLFEGKKLGLFLALWLPSLLFLLIPVAGGFIYTAIGIILGAMISCLDFFDGPQERRRMSFRQKLATVRATLPGSLSFGVVAAALVAIPLVNLLAIPLCVVAGNLFVLERRLVPTQTARRPGSPASGPAA